jgi:DNA invertase Pin-like site-specific DNA recombinase
VAEPPRADRGEETESADDGLASARPTDPQATDGPLPRGRRRRRRARADRGLPPDNQLAALATSYLERQRKLWPKLVEAGLLPEPSDKVVCEMVADFKHRHRTGKVELEQIQAFARIVLKLGGNYDRYSCDNSSPTSILDQMARALEKAHSEGRFVPWAYVFCDYSVSGLDASRQGYASYKAVLSDPKHLIETTYIDDFTRAGRDEIEWWRLAALSKRCNKRLIGASDGFDLSNPNSDLLITMFGLVSRLFIKGLREKVRRGMRGAARRGTVLGKLPLGFTRKVHREKNGDVVYRPDGRPRHELCIDPETQKHRALMFELFSVKKWSAYQIAKHFNDLKVDGWDGWTESGIKKLLVGLDAMGIFIWNRTRREYDVEQDKIVIVENPRSEWERYIDPKLRLVPVEWWMDARRRLRKVWDKSGRTGPKPSRNQISATTLFSGALDCEYCNGEIKLLRSAGKYKQMGCLNGMQHAHDCKLSSSKSVTAIEDCLLGFIRANLFTEPVVEKVLKKANAFFGQEACKTPIDTAPLKAEARKLVGNIRKYQAFIEEEPDEALCRSHNARIKELQGRLNELQAKIREADHQNRKPPKPLSLDRSKVYVPDLRELLNQEVPMAAEAIRTLCGPIKIRQEKIPGRPGARWIATFSPDVVALLRKVAQEQGHSDASSLAAATIETQSVEVVIDKVPRYELLAPLLKQMRDNGASVQSIAHAHGLSWDYADQILKFADTGQRPKWGSGKGGGKGKAKPCIYKDIAPDVIRMRNDEKKPFEQIASILGVGIATVCRAYDFGCPDAVREAAEEGKMPRRGSSSRLGEEKFEEIRKMLRKGKKDAEIATAVGCGTSTVGRVRQKMRA